MLELILITPYYIFRFLVWLYLMIIVLILSFLTFNNSTNVGYEMFKKHTEGFNSKFN